MKKLFIFGIASIVVLVSAATSVAAQTDDFCYTFQRNLKEGDRGPDVSRLHQVLQKEGFDLSNADDWEQRVFGDLTADAVTGFQQKYQSEVLTPSGLKYGTGYVGPATRRKLNALYGCGASPARPRPQVPPTTDVPSALPYVQNPSF